MALTDQDLIASFADLPRFACRHSTTRMASSITNEVGRLDRL